MIKAYYGPNTKTVAIGDDKTDELVGVYNEENYFVDLENKRVFCSDWAIESEKTGTIKTGSWYPIDKKFIADFKNNSESGNEISKP